ncbi:ERCC4 domain-containing protein [Plectosphaerella cucumerina]|uniref:ERCC4 domain-containing protein n=1 Tax=Plectosphaerella cucumerina TaxID=40658 RepID=A0A8K0TH29_9PEZI|nr:ERCC4 domain-containing protein [Plectosphaerella cucumerina]
MVAEVIDLLSSSSPPPARAPTTPPRHAFKWPTSSKPPILSDDVFDLAQLSPVAGTNHNNEPPVPSQQLPPPKRPSIATANPVFFESDDFDTTGDLDKSLAYEDIVSKRTESNKRRRLSPDVPSKRSSLSRSQSAIVGSSFHSVRNTGTLSRSQALIDPIEFTSSPFVPPSAQPPRVDKSDPFVSSPPKPSRLETRTYIPPSSFDPFASDAAPLPAPSPAPVLALAPPSSYDPFASDIDAAPAPAPAPAKKRTPPPVIDLDDDDADSDPFKSSPVVPGKTATLAPPPAAPSTKPKLPKRPVEWDPISSSAPELRHAVEVLDDSPPRRPPPKASKGKGPAVISLSDSEVSTQGHGPLGDDDDDDEFPDLANMDMTKYRPRVRSSSPIVRPARKKAASRPKAMSKKSAEERARERDDKAAARDAEKERKRLDKEAAKEQKARDKQRAAALAEVNKVRTDKKVSTPEMIVDLPASLPPALALQAQELLKDLSVEYKTCQTPVDNVVKWRRKVQSNYNEDLGMWEPMPLRIDDESYAMAVVTADDFVTMALAPEGEDLDAHVAKMRQHYPTEQTIYLIDGLNVWMRKNRNVRNRQFVSAVRGQEDDAPTSSTARKRKTQTPRAYIDEDMIEDALLQLQVVHGVQIHHTAAPIETAQWIAVFTQHISTVPYRKQKEAANAAGAGFCMESGQVRTGEDVRDTYTKMLQEIVRVTAPIAYGIANEFGTVSELIRGLEEGGPLVLEACRKSANKDGALSDRAVGQAVSRRLHKVFTGRDETSTDV